MCLYDYAHDDHAQKGSSRKGRARSSSSSFCAAPAWEGHRPPPTPLPSTGRGACFTSVSASGSHRPFRASAQTDRVQVARPPLESASNATVIVGLGRPIRRVQGPTWSAGVTTILFFCTPHLLLGTTEERRSFETSAFHRLCRNNFWKLQDMGIIRSSFTFLLGTGCGIYIAQNYNVPNVNKLINTYVFVLKHIERAYRKDED